MAEVKQKNQLQVCLNKRPSDCCESRNALQLYRELKKRFGDKISVKPTTCLGLCKQGPALKLLVHGEEHLMVESTIEKVQELLDQNGI